MEGIFFCSRHLAASGSIGWYAWHPVSKGSGRLFHTSHWTPLQQRTSHPKYLQFHGWESPVVRDDEFQACQRNTRLDKQWPAKKQGLLPSSCCTMPLTTQTNSPLQVMFPVDLGPRCEGYRRTERVLEVETLSKRTSSLSTRV